MLIDRELIAKNFLHGEGIEIGALHNPLIFSDQCQIKYVDRMCKEDLYAQYPELANLPLVDVDIIDDGEFLNSISSCNLDFIIANHFLEHCENPILTLINFYRVLKDHGVIYLAIPNRGFTFDKNRDRTTLHHLINDFENGPESSRLEHFMQWAQLVEPFFGRNYSLSEASHRAKNLMDQDYSIHFHVWIPDDVIELIFYLYKNLAIYLEIIFFTTRNDEMIFVLKKSIKPLDP